jgi:hypothetical protein
MEEKFSKPSIQPGSHGNCGRDKNSSFLEINESFGRSPAFNRQIIGRTSTELACIQTFRDLQESRKRLLADGGDRNPEFRSRKIDLIIGLISAELIEINGRHCAIATAVDITGERLAERPQESEELTGDSSR